VLHTFITVPDLPRDDWMFSHCFQLLFQNLILEQRSDIRDLTFAAFKAGSAEVASLAGALDSTVTCNLEDWFEMVMSAPGSPLDETLFAKGGKIKSGYNVDKPMLAGDLSLVPMETLLETRITGATALALLRKYDSEEASLLLTMTSSPHHDLLSSP
jgi:TATA-binding protein-associated factor